MKTNLRPENHAGISLIRYRILSILCTLMITVPGFPQGENWRIISEQPTPRHNIGSCVVDGKIYCIGGMSHTGGQTFFSLVTVFDPETGVWDTCQSMPGRRTGLFASEINGKIYAFGGRRSHNTENLKVVEIYDIEKDEWSTGTSMPNGAAYAAGCVLDGRIYIIGGLQQSGWMATNQMLRYNPVEDSWEILAEMNVTRSHISANVVNNKIYAIGGGNNNPERTYNVVEEYDPKTNIWVGKTAIPSNRAFHAGVVINDRIWLMSGTENYSTIKTTVEIYNPAHDTWSTAVKADIPLTGWTPASAAINSKVYLYGGSGAPDFRDVPDVIVFDFPVIRLLSDTLLTTEDTLRSRFHEEGELYIVPEGTPAELDSITKYTVGSWQGVIDQELSISLNTFSTGSYFAYGVASNGRIDRAMNPFRVIVPTYVEFPDTIFRDALMDLGVDINEDMRISLTEAWHIQTLDISQKGISDLTGIEAFVNLDTLDCSGNPLDSPSFSDCSELNYLDCSHCDISNLNLLTNNALTHLNCSHNNLTVLDLQNNSRIQTLNASGNQLNSIDVSNNIALEVFDCSGNQITDLDLSNKVSLEYVDCSNNQLTSLDVSRSRNLSELRCSSNQLSSLDLMDCNSLEVLVCGNNLLSTLNISRNLSFVELSISEMPTLCKVCIWKTPFPTPEIDTSGSPNVFFTSLCSDFEAPIVSATDSLYQPTKIKVKSSENGMIYLVLEDTEKQLCVLRNSSLYSVEAIAYDTVQLIDSLKVLTNGVYWIYAVDESFNVSEPKVLKIFGVGVDLLSTPMVRIYPNPIGDLVTIETGQDVWFDFEISNVNGQLVHHGSFFGSSNQIDVSILQKGIYIFAIRTRDFNIIRKVVKR